MYTTKNFRTKKELKQAVGNSKCQKCNGLGTVPGTDLACPVCKSTGYVNPVTLYAPGLGSPVRNGFETVEGPHFPEPHRWYATVTVRDGIVVAVN